MTEEYTVVCNHKTGTSAIAKGAKCYITWFNWGNGADRVRIWVRSRGGRSIEKIESLKKLHNFRCAWKPDHIVAYGRMCTKEEAQEIAENMIKWVSK